VVLCPKTGLSLFDELHSGRRDRDVILYAFDLLELNGKDQRALPLEERKARLTDLLAPGVGGIELSEHIEADGATVFRHACKLGCEGIVSKRRASPYCSGWTKTWIKVKNPASPAMTRVWERDAPPLPRTLVRP
jgi:bifunctional non-homologous end joining protein LigD